MPNVDVAPTLLALAGLGAPGGCEGRSLVPMMTGAAEEVDRPTYAALGVPLFRDASIQTTVSDGAWTYARNAHAPEGGEGRDEAGEETGYEARAVAPGAEFLFDRSVDPGENVNLVRREPDEATRMRALLDAHLAVEGAGVVEQGVRIDPGIADRLRAMGYLR